MLPERSRMMSMLGGLGTVWGPPLGAAIIYLLQDFVWGNLADFHLLALDIYDGNHDIISDDDA